jgi:hypothetical protein
MSFKWLFHFLVIIGTTVPPSVSNWPNPPLREKGGESIGV